MIKKNIQFELSCYDSFSELSKSEQELIQKARQIASSAYAPYSGFHVGAALLLENGEIITGNNQENAAYPSGICAERTAIFYAKAHFPDVAIQAIAITASVNGEFISNPAYPCGACRQVLLEARNRSGKPMKVILAGDEKTEILEDARNLLPLPFENLE